MAAPAGKRTKVVGTVVVLAVVAGICLLSQVLGEGEMGGELGEAQRVAEAWFEHLRAGRESEARMLWTAAQRETEAPDTVARELSGLVAASDLLRLGSGMRAEGRVCVSGGIGNDGTVIDDISHSVRFFTVEERGAWRIEAVQVYDGSAPRPPWPDTWHPKVGHEPHGCTQGY